MMGSLSHTTGFINVNKAKGASSAKEVAVIKRLSGRPCGHMGTLDPMASGVLPVAIGNAARLFDYFLSKHKTYLAEFTFGIDSDTLDTTGNIVYNAGRIPSKQEVVSVLQNFTGDIMQVPPRYSAKNINGKRGYELARQGQDFTLPPKQVTVYSIKLLNGSDGVYNLEIECGGGTYVRSLARDIAASLGTYAVMSALVRTKSGVFDIQNSVQTECLTKENLGEYIIPTDSVLPYASINLNAQEEKKLLNGVPLYNYKLKGEYKIYLSDGSFYGVGKSDGEKLITRIKLC